METNVQNIVVGDIDRDERTNGKGIELLKNNNLNVSIENGVNDFLNPGYKIKNDKPEIFEAIQSSGKLDEETENQLKQVIEEYKKNNA